ncbi:MAG: hypothetical protein WCO48_02255 [Candidatus Taylorbacteria bacterium]
MLILEERKPILVSTGVGMLQEELKGHNFYSVALFFITGGLYALANVEFRYVDKPLDRRWKMYRQADPGIEDLVFNPDNLPERIEHLLIRIRENFVGLLFQDLEMSVIGESLTISRIEN